VTVALCVPASVGASTSPVTSGVITVGRGANGVQLGMSRAQVIAKLGSPAYENGNGYMQFVGDSPRANAMFDVYRDGGARWTHVRMLGIAGPGFRLSDGNHVFATGGLGRLRGHYGARLKFHQSSDGTFTYELVGRFKGRRVQNDFDVTGASADARVLDVFILFS
jgi:hypothetical protein